MKNKPQISLTQETHRGHAIVALRFKYDIKIIQVLKGMEGSRWSNTKRFWYFKDGNGIVENIKGSLEGIAQINNNGQKKTMDENTQPKKVTEKPIKTNPCKAKPVQDVQKDEYPILTIEKDVSQNRMFFYFKYNKEWINEIKKLDGAWWHSEAKIWSAILNHSNMERAKKFFTSRNSQLTIKDKEIPTRKKQKQKSTIDSSIVDKKFIVQLKLLNRKENTINNYKSTIAHYLHFFKGDDVASIPDEKIRDYILDHRERQGYSVSYQRLMVSALKNYYAIVYDRELNSDEIPYPEKSSPLPKVISLEDVGKMIQLTVNPKHKMILLMLYGLGLRRSELANLKVSDIDFKRNTIAILNAKGYKDRTLPLPSALLTPIKNYLRDFLPSNYFLIGQKGGKYSTESILKVVKKAAIKAKIQMTITPHILRHCFATHSLEKGIDLRYVQAMLGHKSSKTTEIYTHVSTKQLNKLSNPLDDIKF